MTDVRTGLQFLALGSMPRHFSTATAAVGQKVTYQVRRMLRARGVMGSRPRSMETEHAFSAVRNDITGQLDLTHFSVA